MTAPVAPSSIPGPADITRIELDNGLVVLVRENHAAPVAVIDGYVPAGSLHDPAGRRGLGSFTASMLSRGSAHYSFDQFNAAIENIGASLSAGATDHSTDFGATSLSEDFPTMVEVLADILRRPTFPTEHIGRVRNRKLIAIQEREQDTQQVANLGFYAALYPDHPYGIPTLGLAEAIVAITQDDLVNFHAQRYTPNGAAIIVTGDVNTGQVLDLIHRHFGDWRGTVADKNVPPLPTPARQRRDFALADKVQADIMIGNRSVPRLHPDYYAVRVANSILGGFGMMGRLGETIREQQGLAYYAYSSQDAGTHTGTWFASAGVNPANIEVTISSIYAEFDRLASEPVLDAELADSQAYLTGVLPLTLETNEGVGATLANMEWYGLGLDFLGRYRDLIYRITPADVQAVAQRYLTPADCVLIVAGPDGEG